MACRTYVRATVRRTSGLFQLLQDEQSGKRDPLSSLLCDWQVLDTQSADRLMVIRVEGTVSSARIFSVLAPHLATTKQPRK